MSSQTIGAKISSREGNSPDYMLRSLNNYLVVKEVINQKQLVGKLRSSYPLKKA